MSASEDLASKIAQDRTLAEVDDRHGLITMMLRKMQRGNWVTTPSGYRQVPADGNDRARLRAMLQAYVDKCLAIVDEINPQ
jgi:hypothetical protein